MGEMDILSENEIDKIRSAAFTDKEKVIIEMLLSTSCKRDELIKIQKSDIEDRRLSVGDRKIYLNNRLKSLLNKYIQSESNTSKYLFPDKTGEKNISLSCLSCIIKRVFGRAGIKESGHSLRNTYISNKLALYQEICTKLEKEGYSQEEAEKKIIEVENKIVDCKSDNECEKLLKESLR